MAFERPQMNLNKNVKNRIPVRLFVLLHWQRSCVLIIYSGIRFGTACNNYRGWQIRVQLLDHSFGSIRVIWHHFWYFSIYIICPTYRLVDISIYFVSSKHFRRSPVETGTTWLTDVRSCPCDYFQNFHKIGSWIFC